MTQKTPEQMFEEAKQTLGYQVAENLLAMVSLPVKLLSKAWTFIRAKVAELPQVEARKS